MYWSQSWQPSLGFFLKSCNSIPLKIILRNSTNNYRSKITETLKQKTNVEGFVTKMHVVKSISHKMKEGVHEVSLQRRVEMRNTSFLFKFLGSPKPVGEPLPICLFAQIPASQAHFLGKALLSSFPRNHFELFTFHVLQFYLITKHLHGFHYLTFITFREKWVFKLI